MLKLAALDGLTDDVVLAQWRQVRAREPVGPDGRQGPYLLIEQLLCFGLFFVLNPHRYGGANIHTAPPALHQLAALFRRSPGSLSNKMLNFDGSRTNAGRGEVELFLHLSTHADQWAALYRQVLRVGWSTGLSATQLPDFLDSADRRLEVLGQDVFGSEEIAVLEREGEQVAPVYQEAFDFSQAETTRLVEQVARIGQHRFAKAVLQNYDHSCAFCGLKPGAVRGAGLLVASHIKPWRAASSKERLDPSNGIAACPMHDRAFDAGLLTVNGGYRIHRSAPLQAGVAADAGMATYFAAPVLRPSLIVPAREAPKASYLRYHQEQIYRGRV
jgi:putative restriction endonuclease